MENTAYNVLLFALGVGLALILYFAWKKFDSKDCICGVAS